MTIIEATDSGLRANLRRYFDRVTDDCEILVIKRPGEPDIAILSFAELDRLKDAARGPRSVGDAE